MGQPGLVAVPRLVGILVFGAVVPREDFLFDVRVVNLLPQNSCLTALRTLPHRLQICNC